MSPTIVRLNSLVKTVGVTGLFVHLWRRFLVFKPGGQSFRLFLVQLTTPTPSADALEKAKHHTFRFGTREELELLADKPGTGLRKKCISHLDNGCRCLLQLDGDKLVGFTWVSDSPLIELLWGIHYNLASDMAYNFHGYTTKPYRGTAFQSVRHIKLLELIKPEGKTRLLGYVDHLNHKSLRGVKKSGYVKIGELCGTRRKGVLTYSCKTLSRSCSNTARIGPSQYSVDELPNKKTLEDAPNKKVSIP